MRYLLIVLLFVAGCAAKTETRGYAVTVENRGDGPVTLWLTKSGGQSDFEPAWASPEDVQVMGGVQGKAPAIVLPAGSAADLPPGGGVFEGTFRGADVAVLRIYSGDLNLSEMLATKPNGTLREDVTLRPGRERVIIESASPLEVSR